MELSQLVFKADTTELDKAANAVRGLVDNIKAIDSAAQSQARTDALMARTAKKSADARLQNARASEVELNTAIKADRADQAREQSIKKTTDATEKASRATANNVSILERQKTILEKQTEGFSRGQASILATAKAAGMAASEIEELEKVLETQRKLMGSDPFDKSIAGIKSLENAYRELREATRQYNTGSDLTVKQSRDLARDKERIIERMKLEGATFQSIRQAVREYNGEFVKLAQSYNKAQSAEANILKSRQDAAKATQYLITQDQKMAAALDTSNSAFDKAGSDSLVRYADALQKSGLAQDVQTAKLAAYRQQLIQVQAQEEKRKAANLSRALSPQLTDVAVSLYSGQAPLTVLLQQGGQILDLFKLSGIEAQNFGKAMRESFQSMIPAMATVGKGIAGFVIGGLADAGKAVSGFVANVTGLSAVMELIKRAIASGGEENFKYIASLNKIGAAMGAIASVGIAAVIVALVGLAVGLKQTITESNELSKALALTGGSLGLNIDSATAYARGMGAVGVTTSQAVSVITEMAKAGNFTASEIALVTKAAVDLSKYGGVAIEDTVKSFAKLKEKPVEALIELAKSAGYFAPEVIKAVAELMNQGRVAEATALAVEAAAASNSRSVERMKADYNGFSLFVIELGSKIKNFFSETFKTLFYNKPMSDALNDQLGEVQKRIDEIKKNQETNSFFGIKADPRLLENLQAQENSIKEQIKFNRIAAAQAEENRTANVEAAKILGITLKVQEKTEESLDKQTMKTANLNDYRKLYLDNRLKDLAKENAIDISRLRTNEELVKSLEKQADIEYSKLHKKDDAKAVKQATRDYENYNDVINKANGLASDYNNKLQALQATRERGKITEEQYIAAVEDLIRQQPFYIKQQKDAAEAHELSNKLIGKANLLGKEYLSQLEQIDRFHAQGQEGFVTEKDVANLKAAAYASTELAKEYMKGIALTAKTVEQQVADTQKVIDLATIENEKLDARVELLGLTTEQARQLRIEQESSAKLLKVELELQRAIAKIQEDARQGKYSGAGPGEQERLIVDAEKAAAEQRKVINREVAVAYAEDLDREVRHIKEGIAESVVTALFEGGKAGSSKLRSVVIDALRKPVSLVVNALVNSVLGDGLNGVIAALTGKGGAAGAGSSLGGFGGLLAGSTGGAAEALGSLASTGANLASKGLETFGNALTSTANSLAGYTKIIDGAGSALGYLSSLTSFAKGKTGEGLGSAVGTYLGGPIGAAIGSTIGKWLDKAFGGETRVGGQFAVAYNDQVVNNRRGQTYTYEGQQYDRDFSGGARNKLVNGQAYRLEGDPLGSGDSSVKSVIANTAKGINDMLRGLGSSLSLSGFWAGLETSEKGRGGVFAGGKLSNGQAFGESGTGDNYRGTLYEKFSSTSPDFDKAIKDFTLDLKQSALQALQVVTDIPESVKSMLSGVDIEGMTEEAVDALLKQINDVVSGVTTLKASFEAMGLQKFADISFDAAAALGEAAGGFDKLRSNLESYYDNFYTESEKQANVLASLTRGFAAQNVELPKTRAEYRKLVESQDLTTDAGRKMYAFLLELSGAFASITEEANNSTEALEKRASVQDEIDKLLGNDRKVLDRQRGIEFAAAKADSALQGLLVQLWQLQDAANAAAEAQSKAEKRGSVQDQIDTLQGNNRKVVDRQRGLEFAAAGSDEALQALLVTLWKLQDAAEAAAKEQAKLEKRMSVQDQIDTLLGNDRKVLDRKRSLEFAAAADDEELQALLVNLWKLEDAASASAAAAEAAAEAERKRLDAIGNAYSALEKSVAAQKDVINQQIETVNTAVTALRSLFDILDKSVSQLYNQVSSTATMSYTAARNLISASVGTVLAGGAISDTARLGDAVNTSVSGLAAGNFASKTDYDRERLRLAAQLAILSDSTKLSLTTEEKTLGELENQSKKLDETLDYWKQQVDIAKGTYQATLTVGQSIQQLISLLTPKPANPTGTAGTSKQGGAVTGAGPSGGSGASTLGKQADGSYVGYDGILTYALGPDRANALGGITSQFAGTGNLAGYYAAAAASGFTLKEIAAYFGANYSDVLRDAAAAGIPAFATGGSYAGGMAIVGEQGPEMINFNRPGTVYNSGQTSQILSNAGSASSGFSANAERLLGKIADNTEKTQKVLTNVTNGGDEMQINTNNILELS